MKQILSLFFCFSGQAFDDQTLSFPDFQAAKGANPEKFPLGQMPVLTLPNGTVVTQSGAHARYAAKLAGRKQTQFFLFSPSFFSNTSYTFFLFHFLLLGLYPTDPEEALLVDEIAEVVSELTGKGM